MVTEEGVLARDVRGKASVILKNLVKIQELYTLMCIKDLQYTLFTDMNTCTCRGRLLSSHPVVLVFCVWLLVLDEWLLT